jgi:hypothetical protein
MINGSLLICVFKTIATKCYLLCQIKKKKHADNVATKEEMGNEYSLENLKRRGRLDA